MKDSFLLKVAWVVVACVALGWAPKSVFAQHRGGGHAGGGGFHGGGGGGFHGSVGGFHGGVGHYAYGGGHFGGYYGRGYYGGHRGYYGHGANWGYPRYVRYGYGYRYGWGFGFGWGWPYWYPYGYGYSPWSYTPSYDAYYYPYYAPYGYSYPDNGGGDAPPSDNHGAKSHDNSPVKPSTPAAQSAPNTYMASSNVAAFASTAPLHTTGGTIATARDHRPAQSEQQFPPLRREVQNALRAVREMPPFALQRRIDSGLYNDFTPEERTLLDHAAQFQLAWEKP
jgi:hypothetical protein